MNVQLVTERQYTIAYDVFPTPTDTLTLVLILDMIENNFFNLPKYISSDAGYDNEQNYDDVINNRKCTPLITYNMYRKVYSNEKWERQKEYIRHSFQNRKQVKSTANIKLI